MIYITSWSEPVGESKYSYRIMLQCEQCGAIVIRHHSKCRKQKTCGCVSPRLSHGYARKGNNMHPLYRAWAAFKNRCYNPNNRQYKRYGARGIKVCRRWISSPKTFVEWGLRNGWKPGLIIDRKNNNGNYEPRNIRFVDSTVSAQNRRVVKLTPRKVIIIRRMLKEGLTASEIAKRIRSSIGTIYDIKYEKTWRNVISQQQ